MTNKHIVRILIPVNRPTANGRVYSQAVIDHMVSQEADSVPNDESTTKENDE